MKTEKQAWFSGRKSYVFILCILANLALVVLNSCTEGNSKEKAEEEVIVPVLELQPESVEVPQTYICLLYTSDAADE